MPQRKSCWLYIASIATYIFLYTPLFVVVVFSFNDSPLNAQWTGFTTHWYKELVHNDRLLNATCNSLIIAIVTSIVATLLGTLAGAAIHKFKQPFLRFLVLTPLAIPELLMGCSFVILFVMINQLFIELFDWNFLALGMTTVIIAHITFCIGLVAIVVSAQMKNMDESCVEAARDLGANPWQAFCLITLPNLLPSIIVGALMSFTLSIDDFVISFFTAGAGVSTLPLEIYTKIRVVTTPEINAISSLLILFSGLLAIIAMKIAPSAFLRHKS